MKQKYWIGDLCYVMHPEWDEFCSLTITDRCVTDGVFTLADGRKFGCKGTAYGDGTYHDQNGKQYPVDAGLIGVIALEDIRDPLAITGPNIGLGNIYEFDSFPDVASHNGVIQIGNIFIPTAFDEDCDDEEYSEEEEDDF
jgi:hypothetical protein